MNQVTSPEAQLLGAKIDGIKEDVSELRNAVSKMADALNSLVRVEQKQLEHSSDITPGSSLGRLPEVRMGSSQ